MKRKACYHDKTQKKSLKKGRSAARNAPPFSHEFRLKVAQPYVEDGYPAKLVASQFGISEYSVYRWGKITAQTFRLAGKSAYLIGLIDDHNLPRLD